MSRQHSLSSDSEESNCSTVIFQSDSSTTAPSLDASIVPRKVVSYKSFTSQGAQQPPQHTHHDHHGNESDDVVSSLSPEEDYSHSDFQLSPESGSDSFQDESYYSGKGQRRADKNKHKLSRQSVQNEFEDLLRQDKKSHLMKIHQTYVRLWKTSTLCDIVLKLGSTQLPVHSAVVVGHSGLCEKETRDFHSMNTLPIIVQVDDNISLPALRSVVEFMYTGRIEIELSSLVAIHEAARELEVYVVIARCTKLLERLLEEQNIVQTIQVATELGIDALQQQAWSKFAKGFKSFYSRTGFLESNLATVLRILSSDYLTLKSEVEAFEAAMAWLNYRRTERIQHLTRLMQAVRLIHMANEELVACMQSDPAFAVSPGMEILAQASMNKMLLGRDELPSDIPVPSVRTKTEAFQGYGSTVRSSYSESKKGVNFTSDFLRSTNFPNKPSSLPPITSNSRTTLQFAPTFSPIRNTFRERSELVVSQPEVHRPPSINASDSRSVLSDM